MNLNWDSLLEPIFLFILSLIAGTLWVIIPMSPMQPVRAAVTAEATVKVAPVRKAPTTQPLVEEATGLKKESAELGTFIKTLQEQSQLSKRELEQLEADNRRSLSQLESEQKTLDSLKAQLRALEHRPSGEQSQSNQVARENRDVSAETEALQKLLAEREREAGRLQIALENTRARPASEIPRVPSATPANKLPVLLELIHNRAVPFNKEFRRSKLNLFGPTVVERRAEGETVAEIHDPDSSFNEMLDKIRPDKQYVSCLLNSDSFEIFREVRRLVQAKHIDLGWEPADTSSGKITLYPVRITKKPDAHPKANLPRVPPIMR